jgi:hypothetical protein
MEGLAGTVTFFADMLQPERSAFPGFELTAGLFEPSVACLNDTLKVFCGCNLEKHTALIPLPCGGAWCMPLMDPTFCEGFVSRLWTKIPIEVRQSQGIRLSLAEYPFLNTLTNFTQQFVEDVMLPTDRRRLYIRKTLQTITQHPPPELSVSYRVYPWRAYVIAFDAAHHPRIDHHVDNSDFTVNVCLRKTCKGGRLFLKDPEMFEAAYSHSVGEATIFWGDVVHRTEDVTGNGERVQLVVLYSFMRPESIEITQPFAFHSLLSDVRMRIMEYCELPIIAFLGATCRRYYEETNDSLLWRQLYLRNTCLQEFVSVESLESRPIGHTNGNSDVPTLQSYESQVVYHGPDNWKKTYHSAVKAYDKFAIEDLWAQMAPPLFLHRQTTGYFPMHQMMRPCFDDD